MIFDEPQHTGGATAGGAGDAAETAATWPSGAEQERLAGKLLDTAAARPFLESLQREIAEEFPPPTPSTAASILRFFAASSPDQVDQLFVVVRRALLDLDLKPTDDPCATRLAAEKAAVALYFVAACRLVDRAVHAASGGGYVLHVPRSKHIVCAVIATALFGGEIRLLPSDEPELPAAEYVFEVKVAACGDQIVEDFDRAVFAVVMANDRDAPEVGKGSGSAAP